MRPRLTSLVLCLLALSALLLFGDGITKNLTFVHRVITRGALAMAGEGQKVRQPAVAGAFYPADPKELTKMIDEFLAQASVPEIREPILAVISPHAGYIYSGPVAAYSYAVLRGKKFARVVVIAPSHFEAFPFASVYDGDAYATPLGTIPVDKEFAAKLAALNPKIKLSEQGHTPRGQGEHALEVELPFLQRVLGQFKLVPIVMGDQNYEIERALGVSLARLLQQRTPSSPSDTLIVASSDLSHYHPYDDAVSLDHKTLKAIEDWDYLSLSQNFDRRVWEACGGGPIVATMMAAERLGATRALILKYANSGDTTGDHSRVVGYGAVALIAEKGERSKKGPEFSLSQREKDELLKIARQSVETAVREQKFYQPATGGLEHLAEAHGAFVTLKERGELRGCIGYITPVKSLAETVRDVAAFAALEDRRFTPVTAGELGQLQYEVSVLSPLRRVTDVKQIHVGRHGLVMMKGAYEGLLLPQVPTEQGWDRTTFLEQTCVKAGLPRNAWKDEDTDIYMFTALVFGEHAPPEPLSFEKPETQPQTGQPGAPAPGPPHP
jgi:AmmeMemoRadiSam system protein B/AmmeMemoRadiSam system protein A